MRDLHDELSRATMLDLTGQDRPVPPLGRSVAAIQDGPATSVWSGGRKPSSELPSVTIGGPVPRQVAWMIAKHHVSDVYDAATRALVSAGPLPLASTEPWAESDQAYRARLSDYLGYDVTYSGSMLDDYGVEAAELPRARLVPINTMQGEP